MASKSADSERGKPRKDSGFLLDDSDVEPPSEAEAKRVLRELQEEAERGKFAAE